MRSPFPVIFMEKDTELPAEGTYYIIAKDGIYLRKENGIFSSLLKVDGIGGLESPQQHIQPMLPKLPQDVIYRAYRFFTEVFEKHHAEAALVIHYNKDRKRYLIHCPEQIASGIVVYNIEDRFDGFQLVGTIHSHCDGPAGHSSTDVHDEEGQDGMHITLGNVDLASHPYFSAAATIAVNGKRAVTCLENCAHGVTPTPNVGDVVSIDQSRYTCVNEDAITIDVNSQMIDWHKMVVPAEGLDLQAENEQGNLLWASELASTNRRRKK